LELYLSEEIFSKLLSSLSAQLKKDYVTEYPMLVGVGISGIEMVARMPSILDKNELQTYACDVQRVGDEIREITNFPNVKEKDVLLCYVRVDTGRTLIRLTEHALKSGARTVRTMSIAVRSSTECFPNYFSFMLKNEDNLFLLLEGYPPDLLRPYPPVRTTPHLLRRLSESDASLKWLTCGEPELDKLTVHDFLDHTKEGRVPCVVFILQTRDTIIGLAEVYQVKDMIYLACLMVDEKFHGKKLGSKLVSFLIDWGRFTGFLSLQLCSLVPRVGFYESLGFKRVDPQELDEGCVMMSRELY
jgi:GNAT superfamily N-acetyltransferase/hypoxanthine-guanine phosphoribosyltransferase